jgi:hypothetical protein
MDAQTVSKHYGVNVLPQDKQMDKRLAEMPNLYHRKYLRAMSGRSMKSAIKSFCLECVGYQREEVKLCTDLGCPLYPYRPTSASYTVRTRAKPTPGTLFSSREGQTSYSGSPGQVKASGTAFIPAYEHQG